nr:ATP-binding protein [Salipaludibacillus aurantiacus]
MNSLREKIESNQSGGTENDREPEFECPKCKDIKGFIITRDGTEYWRDCTCVAWRRAERLMKSSEITEEFKKKGFKSFRTEGKPPQIKDMYETARDYYMDFDKIRGERQNSISLHGNPGTGKTHLLLAVSNNLMSKRGIGVLYFPYVEGFNDLKDDFDKLEQKLNRMKYVDVLFIDDLFKPARGKPRATDWQVEQTYAVINHRYLNHKPIMISSELSTDEICDIDEALGTRIFEMSKDYTVLVQGDRRELNHRLED